MYMFSLRKLISSSEELNALIHTPLIDTTLDDQTTGDRYREKLFPLLRV